MNLLLLLAATVSAPNAAAEQPVAQRSKARATFSASATIIRSERISPLTKAQAPTRAIERPTTKQRSVKAGVPYVEFY